jgi:hypothetical protein
METKDEFIMPKRQEVQITEDNTHKKGTRSNIRVWTEDGGDVYELDGSLCTELHEDKQIMIYGLLGEKRIMTVTPEHDAEDSGMYAVIQHWENLNTTRKNYICTYFIDKSISLRADFS